MDKLKTVNPQIHKKLNSEFNTLRDFATKLYAKVESEGSFTETNLRQSLIGIKRGRENTKCY